MSASDAPNDPGAAALPRSRLKAFIARRRWWLVGALAVFAYGFTGGCYAQQLPPALSAADTRAADVAPLPYSVVVTPWDVVQQARTSQDPGAYAKAAYSFLQGAGVFRSVRIGSVGDSADLVATSTGAYCNTAAIPLWTGLTLGLIPTIFTDTDCDGVVLRRYGTPHGSDSVTITHQQSGRVVMGWAAVVVGALPGWTHGEAKRDGRTRRTVRLAILRQHVAIDQLVAR